MFPPRLAGHTLKAILVAADSEGPFEVRVFATETPLRPAVLALMPSEVSVTTRVDQTVTAPLGFGEAGPSNRSRTW